MMIVLHQANPQTLVCLLYPYRSHPAPLKTENQVDEEGNEGYNESTIINASHGDGQRIRKKGGTTCQKAAHFQSNQTADKSKDENGPNKIMERTSNDQIGLHFNISKIN